MHCTFSSFFLELCLLLCSSFPSSSFSFLTMASKKSVPSKNPFTRHGSSSSSSFSPNRVWFCDTNSQKDFIENFYDWTIHSKCQVILSDFPNTPLSGALSTQGWGFLCEKPTRCPSVFIQELYSKIHVINTSVPQFTMIFRGTHIIVTPNFISEVLCVPRADRPYNPSHLHLRNIPRDELASLFCEKAMV